MTVRTHPFLLPRSEGQGKLMVPRRPLGRSEHLQNDMINQLGQEPPSCPKSGFPHPSRLAGRAAVPGASLRPAASRRLWTASGMASVPSMRDDRTASCGRCCPPFCGCTETRTSLSLLGVARWGAPILGRHPGLSGLPTVHVALASRGARGQLGHRPLGEERPR